MQRVHNMEYSSAVPPGSNMQVCAFRDSPESMYPPLYKYIIQVHYTEFNNSKKTIQFSCH